MIKTIYRHRYRLVLGTIAGVIALSLGFPHSPVLAALPRGEALLIAATVSFIGALIFLVAALVISPRSPRLVEAVAITYAGYAVLVHMVPALDPVAISGLHGFAVFGFSALLIYGLLYGAALDPWTMVPKIVMSGRIKVNAPCEHIWRCVVPAPGHERYFFYRDTEFVVEDSSPETEWLAIVRDPRAVFSSLNEITLHQIIPGEHFKFGFRPVAPGADLGDARGAITLTIVPAPNDANWIDFTFEAHDAPLRVWLNWVLSDRFNDQMKLIKSRCEDKAPLKKATQGDFRAALHTAE
ncbi:hypothetical protein ACP2AV_12405 [Aliiroseovarius sp. PTFE2010]|uniref:hypothetical protein n=1 Tax=Aliiroseovarius sp. PTFE2010 TaxID=3417190 RepID=UPI003CE8A9EC